MDDIATADSAFVFLLEFQKGSCRIIRSRFDLNGEHLVLCLAVVGDNKVYFNVIATLFFAVMGIEE